MDLNSFRITFIFVLVSIICNVYCKNKRDYNVLSNVRRYNSTGIVKLRSKGYKFNSDWTPSKLKLRNGRRFIKTYRNQLTYYFSGNISLVNIDVPILSVFHRKKELPFLEVIVNINKDKLVFRYQGKVSFQRIETPLHSGGKSALNLLIYYNSTHVTFNCNCVLSTVKLRQPVARFSHNAIIFLQNRKSSQKFQGEVRQSKVYSYKRKHKFKCPEQNTATGKPKVRAEAVSSTSIRVYWSRPDFIKKCSILAYSVTVKVSNTGSVVETQVMLATDSMKTFTGLVPYTNYTVFVIGFADKCGAGDQSDPVTVATLDDAELVQNDDRIFNSLGSTDKRLNSLLANSIQVSRNRLEDDRISQLKFSVDSLTTQNTDLRSKVQHLEDTCVCYPQCTIGSRTYDESQTWEEGRCNICTCRRGRPQCRTRSNVSNCISPCSSAPCKNNGYCRETAYNSYQCICITPWDGPTCEVRINPCVLPPDIGDCNQTVQRYYYDRFEEICLPFNFTGCGGNANNFLTLSACQDLAMRGACCYRRFKSTLQSVISSDQKEDKRCEVLNLGECKGVHRKTFSGYTTEVIGFFPGLSCNDAGCTAPPSGCSYGNRVYKPGEVRQSCQQRCTCEVDNLWICSCERPSVRKEIRDLTSEELMSLQVAIQKVKKSGPGNAWDRMRDMYIHHGMFSHGSAFFLPWHRYYLRNLEQIIQEVDCSVTLPYFDFTTDVGDFANAIIWQPNMFGGNGEGRQGCVPDHPFGQSWRPCIRRRFNPNIQLPSLVELALAISSEDYTTMSLCLEAYVSYLHQYIGGDMGESTAPYDPVFFAIHAFIDKLYWDWQQQGNNKFKFPAAYGKIPMVPFNVQPSGVLDSENDLCVTYALTSRGHRCNRTDDVREDTEDRGDIPANTVDRYNSYYDEQGFDRSGFNRNGYHRSGFNRDGYNLDGYNRQGYDRYGYNVKGYSIYGYNRNGYDVNGNPDTSGRYSDNGFNDVCSNRLGLSREGYDKYGFTVRGYDISHCNYLFNGPFAALQSYRIWEILSSQDKGFLMSVPRTCPRLNTVTPEWASHFWMGQIKDVTSMVPVQTPVSPLTLPSSRFCFDTTSFLSLCTCDSIARCTENPCQTTSCPSYPEAICYINFCRECKAVWYLDGRRMNCKEERDFCEPNPCLNGGTCAPSVWTNEPHLVTCRCPPGFDGPKCQNKAIEVCSLPVSPGSCNRRVTRWYYNYVTQRCEEFIYTGCGGNSNNFPDYPSCQTRCMVGACCYRYPVFRDKVVGYDEKGYDRYGFNVDGFNKKREVRTYNNSLSTGDQIYNSYGYDRNGYNKAGYDRQGLDRQGYNQEGYDAEGFNILGYNRIGEYDGIIEYDKDGYNVEGYNRAGYSCLGNNRRGYDNFRLAYGYNHKCRSLTLSQCQSVEKKKDHQVVSYSQGRKCENVDCGESCGCHYGNTTYRIGAKVSIGCQECLCDSKGVLRCACRQTINRKEIREMSDAEIQRYQNNIRRLAMETGCPSRWFQIAQMYADYKPQAVGSDAFLPWHRYFLRYVEQELQQLDCDVAIPYYDWTIDAGKPDKSIVWSNKYFGGNGEGVTGCVQFHPFKGHNPPYWMPCLRRKFNKEISLPDAVNLQLAVNDPSYTNFRLQMEVVSQLFQSWVGGHMGSDFSPYDPIFLSHLAFIDKIWDTWQKKHPNGLLLYPSTQRYVPMAPFQVTPDDVLESESQMCVKYVPLTEGLICNIRIPVLGFNINGYDRHGYDREGYNKNGYDVKGYDRSGNFDTRGIYNANGYDLYGYNRQGFDQTGFDRFGFYIDMYNLDGFDANGLDKWGFDRYGFDTNGVTPFGFNKNGTWTISDYKNMFDSSGYNRYGFNKYGFDREGFDVFGFNSKGFDFKGCNNYFLGPMYVLIKRWAEIELNKANNLTIRVIVRICPAVTTYPSWRYTTNWLHRGDQILLIERLQEEQQRRHQIDPNYMPRVSSITDERIWLPIESDRRLCFITYYYSKCPIGRLPVICNNDLCRDRKCPGIPDAVCRVNRCGSCSVEWYSVVTGKIVQCSGCIDERGLDRVEGSTWRKSECDTCQCQNSIITCRKTACEPVRCRYPIQSPGQCCPSCEGGCLYQGRIYVTGSTFVPMTDSCKKCMCDRGDVTCQRKPCPDIGRCKTVITLPGDCCPTCMDCGNKVNGTRWRENPCQHCSCINGEEQCHTIRCNPPDCTNPHTPPGECCPTCISCYFEGKAIKDGDTYNPDKCSSCRCNHGNMDCTKKECPPASCDSPVFKPGSCCPVCDSGCDYDMKRWKNGDLFIASYDPCLNCSCKNSIVRCIPIHCSLSDYPCRNPVRKGTNCCDYECPGCSDNGVDYTEGDSWPSSTDPCKVCDCSDGLVSCRNKQICPITCSHGILRRGECCQDCNNCLYDGRVYRDGQTFTQPGDRCQQCTCNRGNVRCERTGICPQLSCRVTETPPGACCPICKGCQYEGRNYRHGDTITADKCSRCICREGELDCQRPQCSPPRCRNPVQQQGDCCPSCTECQYGGQTYQNLQRFIPSESPCLSCQCNKGEVTCEDKKLTCPPSSCSHPDTSPGQCCPSCRGCFFMRRRFRNNQKFVPPGGDACKICLCRDGTVDCQDMGCPPLNCINPVKPPGHCCGTCPMACTVLGKTYNEGQMFDDPKDKCSVCMCTRSRTGNGEVRCQMRSCPQVTCSHPAQRPGECCPSCFMCRYNGQNILNGQNYIDPRQPCVECSCSYGIVTCTDKIGDCPPISCPYPETEPGSCCPVCKPKDCVINGVVFKEGLTFTNPDDRCQDCQCDRGQPRCRTRSCPEVRCRYPSFTADKCCQECVDCSFNGLVYKNGISFDHPTERCQTCQCSNGEVQCRRKECPSVSCQYPVMAGCCPVCAGCQYQNKRYEDGQRFISAEDSCLQCTCTSGNIVKRRNPCPSVTCQHPVQGTCCQECNNCLYENRVYRNRQRFPDPSSQCNVCECRDGTVACTPRDCPLISCSNPASGACCPECSNCQYNGELVRNGGNVQSTDDPCKQCYCRNGNIECRSQTCVQTNCQYPVRRGCCQECSDCMYQGKEQRNNDMFPDPTEKCNECLCRDGNVNCRRKSCPPVQCNSPVAGDCCPTCGDCYHKNVLYSDGAQFNDVSDPCMKCSCSNGNVRCARKDCNGRKCTHPVQGRCCPQCGGDCLFDGKRYDDGVTFKNRCEECTCTKGSVTCIPTRCLPVTCSHPVSDECCQVCTDCLYDRKRYRNSDRFQDPDDACQECYCQDGTVRCVKKQCPAVTCSDPVQGQCCPECTDCTYAGQFVRHGNTVADSKDPCSTCTCQFGSMICTRKTCAPASCDYPVTENQCGCQTCTGCDFRSGVYTNGERFRHPQDTCQQCTCQNGNVRCSRVTCRETCDHPANTTDCCPVCRDCFYEGMVQRNGVTFESDVDPCRSCSCRSGNIVCETVICPVPRCDNPVTNRGECCPVCTVCQFHGGTFGDGQTFSNPRDKCQTCTCRAGRVRCDAVSCDVRCSHPRQGDCCPVCDDCMYEGRLIGNGDQYKPDPCNTCSCQSGNVGCLTQTCPRLTCPRTEKLPGQCCDVCLGCRYNGIYHSDGDAWTIDNNPCKTCACRGGIVTCMEMHCFSTCDNPINVPGQCCPVCPTCRHRDRVYSDGDMFSPSGDPCDLCECKGGRMTCHYVMCPATSNCPAEQIISPSVGKCCPTCSGGGQNCTRETYGMTILPKPSDPCVSCQCTSSLSWICRKEVCPLLNCPPAVQLKEDRECCPKCPPCHDTTTDRYYRVGDVWTDRDNLCLQCRCVDKAGSKSCRLIGCQALNCRADEREVRPPGECCKVCEEYPKTPCQYDGVRRQSGETWKKDACTTCKCYGDNVDCTKEQCIDPDCSPDYSLVTQPGQCCPVCVLQPGSCIVYGDPHYQTFDGNTVHFQGNCRYIMSEDCEGSGDFRVEVTHHDRGFSGISWAQNFTIVIGRTRIDLLQNFEVRVDGLPMNLPYKSRRDFTIDVKDQTILLDTTLGLQFVWNGESYAALTVPGTYKRQLCGLCGNFNGFDRDDMKTSSMQITNSPSVFGNSWKTKSQLNPRCRDAEDFDPCDAQIFRTRKYAQQQCSVLTGPKFSRCHRVVNPQSFFTSCVYDVCACGVEETCLCELLEAYVLECARNGVRLEWRSEGLCALDCEEEKGFVFDECGPVCPRDCSNYQTPISDMPEQCYKPCEASCQCPADKVLHEGRCINPTQCPPTNRGDIPVNGR